MKRSDGRAHTGAVTASQPASGLGTDSTWTLNQGISVLIVLLSVRACNYNPLIATDEELATILVRNVDAIYRTRWIKPE